MANGSPESGGQAAARGSAPSISIPKSGGAVRDLGEKFEVNAVNGTSSLSVPIPVDGGRAGMKPTLTLAYNAASGNGPFGLGWDLSLPEITRKTDKGIPRYDDAGESDTFILSGVEDLVRVLVYDGHDWRPEWFDRSVDGVEYRVQRYRPRIEGLFARIERWTNRATGDVHWRSTTSENVTSIYGRTANSRISDPDDPSRCFRWLICESYDDTGNAIAFEYKRENSDGVDVAAAHEANRSERDRSANRYLKRIRYGNLAPTWDRIPPSDWMFEVVLDYGEHSPDAPRPAEEREWICRHDAFSSYRSSFEVRTYRLCQRILIFHHFPNEARVGADCLVRSMDLAYRGDAQRGEALGSFLASITERGYARRPEGDYIARAIPPLDLQYTEARIHDQIQDVDIESVENLPSGARAGYIWSDLDGEGLSGILSQQADAWFYKPNIGNARFGRVQVVSPVPSMAALESGRQQLMDVDSDGRIELVSLNPRIAGYYERGDPGWASFQTFHATPQIDWTDPNLRWIDLDGDGLSDVLITEDYAFIWYRSLGTEGFSAGRRVFQPSLDERQGPRLVFSDADRSIYLADMSGDGLSDLVRIRNGEVCYWPNLGYGRFGSKITMDRAPRFDMLDLFDQSRVRLADIDGSGTTDIIYLGRGGAFLFFNELGNRWTDARQLPMIPETHNIADVSAVDLFGNATTCLVWSSSEPSAAARPMRYIDLMGGTKPHLLARIDNNLGAERRLHYASSTRFYLADRRVGRPWITRLPFPVQVVERQILYDRVSRNQSQTRYRYHHGFYDGVEREFRGFGMVEQLDTEYEYALSGGDAALGNVDVTSNLPPVLAKTWFHVGDFQPQRGLTRGYEHEYYCEPGTTAAERQVMSLPDSTAPDDLTPEELREACRAMKSSVLRREVYAEDGSEKASRPYTVTEINYTIRLLQPFGPNRHASYFVHTRETVDFNYERAIFPTNDVPRPDPRVTHSIALAVDEYGNLLRSASLAYGRRFSDPELPPEARAAQQTTRVTLTIASFTNAVLDQDNYRLPATADSRTYELFNLRVPAVHPDLTNLVRFDDLYRRTRADSHGGHDLPYSDYTGSGAIGDGPYRRLIEESRTIYRRDDLSGPLPAGRLESLALPYADYQRSLTPELVLSVFGNRVSEDMLETGGYARLDGDAGWWKPSGRIFYSPVREDSPAEELEFARRHFFAPQRFENPFGNSTAVTYDRYTLLVQETRDALDNRTTAGERDREGAIVRQGNDYRVLKPWLVMDENRNRTEAAFDALGVVVVTAARGKPEEDLGDTIDGVDPDLPEEAVLRHLERPLVNPLEILGGATSRMVYDLFAYSRSRAAQQPLPSAIYTVARTIHRSELKPEQETHVIHTFTFVDGFGREIQKKAQAEPGPLDESGSSIAERWAASGWTIFNNKGKPVRQYEPFFTATPAFEFGNVTGVSSILFYDPGSRVVARLHPNHAFEKVVFDPWRQASWDVNDTVLIGNPAKDADAGDFFRRLPDAEYRPTWYEQRRDGALGALEREAAEKTVVHAGTPSYAYFDAMGRAFLAIAHNRFRGEGEVVDERYSTRFEIDVEGNQRSVTDAKGRVVMRTDFDLLGVALHHANMDSGERWTLGDVTALDIFTWDSRENIVRTTYDALRRPREIFLTAGADSEKLVSRTIYGEAVPEPEARNLRGRVYKTFDTAGLAVAEAYDFRGNTVRSRRQLLRQYDTQPDWNQSPALEEESFEQRTSYDAVGRPIQLVAPHGDRSADAIDVIQPSYNEANLLERVDVWLARDSPPDALLDPMSADLRAIEGIDYNARGQRMRVRNGNRTQTHFEFDPMVFRLARIHTTREGGDGTDVQDLRYVYDPAGNVVSITDKSKPTVWFRNQQVEPDARYTYDAVYRLIEATGREHIGQIAPGYEPRGPEDVPPSPQLNAADAHAFARYRERYVYDQVSNILELAHRRLDAAHQGFTRTYEYAEPSPLDPSQRSNRLSATRIGSVVDRYTYDASGNMTSMPHLTLMRSDYRDQLSASARQSVHHGTPETTHYLYDSHGGRVRKVTVRAADEGTAGTRRTERIYLDGFEVYREYAADGETVRLARSSLYVFDGDRRAVLVETRTIGEDSGPVQVVRFPYTNHLNSAVLELDREGRVISYEEYLPFGVSSYRLADSQAEAPKRFRYNGKERDEESQLYYYGARYYAAWLGRWTGCDPHFRADQSSAYVYVRANPVTFSDRAGNEESSNWNRFMGGLKVLGGAIQTVAGAAVFVQVEVPVAAQVVGGVAVVHGIDDMTTGIDQIISGKTENTVTQQVVAGTAKLAFKEKTAEAIGTGFDIAAGFVSPVPVSGVTGGGTKVVVNMPRVVAVERAGAGMKELIVTTEAVEITVNTAKATQITAGALQATGTLGSGGGGGGGPQKQEQKSEEKPKEQKPPAKTEPPKQAPPREYKVAKTHPSTGGNKQVVVDGQRWNVPKGVDPSKIPAVDKVGDQLQAAAKAAASEWNASKLSAAERQAIATAHADGEHWLARLLEQQAKGRYVEARVRPQFPNLQWNRTGVDAIDSATGIKYDVLSGTESNMTLHAKRMAKELFRMIMF